MTIIKASNLEHAWVETLKKIYYYGFDIGRANSSVKELINLLIEIENGFELDHPHYFALFDKTVYKQVLSIYQSGGRKYHGYNYGERIINEEQFNQIEKVKHLLSQDPLSRSATIVLSRPQRDQRHLPCIMDINFKIRSEKLLMTLIFKSCDIAKKFIPDIYSLGKIHAHISRELQISRGQIHAFIMSGQIHKQDYRAIKNFIREEKIFPSFPIKNTINNWDKEAKEWGKNINKPSHYVNIENGYQRFLTFIKHIFSQNPINCYSKCLDLGCGTGIIAGELKKYSNIVYGIDLSPKMINEARKNTKGTTFIEGNVLDIPVHDQFFDVIVSRGILISHINEPFIDKFFSEIRRVLKRKGYFIFDFLINVQPNEQKIKRNKAVFQKVQMLSIMRKFGFEVLQCNGEDRQRINSFFCIKL